MSTDAQRMMAGEITFADYMKSMNQKFLEFLDEVTERVKPFGFEVDIRLDVDNGNARILKRDGRRILEQYRAGSSAGRHEALRMAFDKWLAVYGGEE